MTPTAFKTMRLDKGFITQAQLAKKLKRSVRQISAYETGHTVIPYHVAESMKALGAKKS